MSRKHTETPWRLGHDQYIYNADTNQRHKTVTIDSDQVTSIAFVDVSVDYSDAKAIVRAVNCHEELLDALKECVPYLEDYHYREGCGATLAQVKAAIAKAEANSETE
jgi:N-acetylglutamate synthase/N-acetylornithine aminotransferase